MWWPPPVKPRSSTSFDKSLTRIAVGDAPAGWHSPMPSCWIRPRPNSRRMGRREADDPMLLYFTSGTTAKPKLVLHSHRSYPVGHLTTVFVLGLRPGDVHLNISSPGWAKHAWSCFFAPWIAGATIFIANQPRFNARVSARCGHCQQASRRSAHRPTVWRMLIQEDLKIRQDVKLREVLAAGEPLNPEVIEQVEKAWGLTIRDFYGQTETTTQVGNPPGQPIKPGSMGRPLPGYKHPAARCRRQATRRKARSASTLDAPSGRGADAGLPAG